MSTVTIQAAARNVAADSKLIHVALVCRLLGDVGHLTVEDVSARTAALNGLAPVSVRQVREHLAWLTTAGLIERPPAGGHHLARGLTIRDDDALYDLVSALNADHSCSTCA